MNARRWIARPTSGGTVDRMHAIAPATYRATDVQRAMELLLGCRVLVGLVNRPSPTRTNDNPTPPTAA